MSKAFTKEDDDEVPERSGRLRSGKGLPPGALNYMTPEGVAHWQAELEKAKGKRVKEIEQLLASVTVIPKRTEVPEEVLLGTTAVIESRGDAGARAVYRVVGVDEEGLAPGWVSWVSPVGKALLGLQVGQRTRIPDSGEVRIVEITV